MEHSAAVETAAVQRLRAGSPSQQSKSRTLIGPGGVSPPARHGAVSPFSAARTAASQSPGVVIPNKIPKNNPRRDNELNGNPLRTDSEHPAPTLRTSYARPSNVELDGPYMAAPLVRTTLRKYAFHQTNDDSNTGDSGPLPAVTASPSGRAQRAGSPSQTIVSTENSDVSLSRAKSLSGLSGSINTTTTLNRMGEANSGTEELGQDNRRESSDSISRTPIANRLAAAIRNRATLSHRPAAQDAGTRRTQSTAARDINSDTRAGQYNPHDRVNTIAIETIEDVQQQRNRSGSSNKTDLQTPLSRLNPSIERAIPQNRVQNASKQVQSPSTLRGTNVPNMRNINPAIVAGQSGNSGWSHESMASSPSMAAQNQAIVNTDLTQLQSQNAQTVQAYLAAQSQMFSQMQQTQMQLNQLILTMQSVITQKTASFLAQHLKDMQRNTKRYELRRKKAMKSTVSSKAPPTANEEDEVGETDSSTTGSLEESISGYSSFSEGVDQSESSDDVDDSDSNEDGTEMLIHDKLTSEGLTDLTAFTRAVEPTGSVPEHHSTDAASDLLGQMLGQNGSETQREVRHAQPKQASANPSTSIPYISPVVLPLSQRKDPAAQAPQKPVEAPQTEIASDDGETASGASTEDSDSEADGATVVNTRQPRKYNRKLVSDAKLPVAYDFSRTENVFFVEQDESKGGRRYSQKAHRDWFKAHGYGPFEQLSRHEFQRGFVEHQRLVLKEFFDNIGFRAENCGNGDYQCTLCKQVFKTRKLVQTHGRMYLPPGQKPFVCPACGTCFSTDYSLMRHLTKLQAGGDRTTWRRRRALEDTPEE